MSVEALAWAKRVETGSPGAKLVLLVLADYADEDWYCYPGQNTIARVSEQSDRTVRRHLKKLEASGWIRRKGRVRTDGSRTSDGYFLHPNRTK